MAPLKLNIPRSLVLAAIVALGSCQSGQAAEVMLQLKDGGFEIGGTLKSFDGTHYHVDAGAYGMLQLEAARFNCTGAGCNQRDAAGTGAQPATGQPSGRATPARPQPNGWRSMVPPSSAPI